MVEYVAVARWSKVKINRSIPELFGLMWGKEPLSHFLPPDRVDRGVSAGESILKGKRKEESG